MRAMLRLFMPFIFQGVTLIGTNSGFPENAVRRELGSMLVEHLNPAKLASIGTDIGLTEAIGGAQRICCQRDECILTNVRILQQNETGKQHGLRSERGSTSDL